MGKFPGRAIAKTNMAPLTERARRMWEMRVNGKSTGDIATEMGISQSRVSQVLSKYSKDIIYPHVKEYREVQIARLEYLWEKLVNSGRLEKGDPAAIASGVRIAERMAKLVGLDAAIKVQAEIETVDPRDIELRGLIEAARAAAEREIEAIKGEVDDNG